MVDNRSAIIGGLFVISIVILVVLTAGITSDSIEKDIEKQCKLLGKAEINGTVYICHVEEQAND